MARSKLRPRHGSCRRRQTIAKSRSQNRNAGASDSSGDPIVDTIYVQTGSPNPGSQPQTNTLLETQFSEAHEARLIRVRVNEQHQIYSADDATGTKNTSPASPVLFRGPLSGFTSLIHMSMHRDIIYFDQPINVSPSEPEVASVDSDLWPITKIAINIDRIRSIDIETLKLSVKNEALSNLILVISSDKAYAREEKEKPDDWGFKHVPESAISRRDVRRHERGLKVVDTFSVGRVHMIEYEFVLEAGARTE
ncbi:hypothetical protein CONLIGDRAFT_647209 [Coniochaeta ligniaria NRRL 30616]|uniref:Uncharacterized protein n=1 Tax=Coniochaeta ligniaria NRRL 30616 TaxID=1408157 RepID=A0A1J7J185_9PEZI|nr:hypothetical protein CONLIGDRAFT_647209 [Coniochaeta ligniaria NRRL 30616]